MDRIERRNALVDVYRIHRSLELRTQDAGQCVLATLSNSRVVASSGSVVQRWQVSAKKLSSTVMNTVECEADLVGHDDRITGLVDAGGLLVSASRDGTARIWSPEGECWGVLASEEVGPIDCVALTASGHRVVTGGQHRIGTLGVLAVWDLASQRLIKIVPIGEVPRWVASVGDEPKVLTISQGSKMKMWSLSSGACEDVPPFFSVLSLAAVDSAGTFALGGLDALVRLWDARTGHCLATLPHSGPVHALAVDPAGERLCVASDPNCPALTVWDLRTLQMLHVAPDAALSQALAFGSNGRSIVSADAQGHVRMWSIVREEDTLSPVEDVAAPSEDVAAPSEDVAALSSPVTGKCVRLLCSGDRAAIVVPTGKGICIGQAVTCDYQIVQKRVSARQLVLIFDGETCRMTTDPNPTTWVLLNGKRPQEDLVAIQAGDVLQIGEMDYLVTIVPDDFPRLESRHDE